MTNSKALEHFFSSTMWKITLKIWPSKSFSIFSLKFHTRHVKYIQVYFSVYFIFFIFCSAIFFHFLHKEIKFQLFTSIYHRFDLCANERTILQAKGCATTENMNASKSCWLPNKNQNWFVIHFWFDERISLIGWRWYLLKPKSDKSSFHWKCMFIGFWNTT